MYLLWNGVHIEEIGFTYKKRAKLEIVRSNYKNYLTRFPCDSLNDDLNSPLSPFLQEQTWSFSPSSGMGHAKSSVWSFSVQNVVEDTVAKTRRRTKNGRNIFQGEQVMFKISSKINIPVMKIWKSVIWINI